MDQTEERKNRRPGAVRLCQTTIEPADAVWQSSLCTYCCSRKCGTKMAQDAQPRGIPGHIPKVPKVVLRPRLFPTEERKNRTEKILRVGTVRVLPFVRMPKEARNRGATGDPTQRSKLLQHGQTRSPNHSWHLLSQRKAEHQRSCCLVT